MKHLVLVGDGMADFPLADLSGKTPLEVARTPAMDAIARDGLLGLFCPIPDDLPPGSDIGNLSLFGYDPHTTFTGRAPIEAAKQGIPMAPNDVAFRCNLVTLRDGVMTSFTSGHIPTGQATELIRALSKATADLPVSFHPGVSYRHLTIVRPEALPTEHLVATQCTPPHDISDRPYAPHLPSGPAAVFLQDLMRRSEPILADHPVNAARIAAGDPPATSIWLWGQGCPPKMVPYRERFGLSGAVISAVDLVNGIGVCAGFEVIPVPGATGYLDTDYAGKVAAAIDGLSRHDFVYVHVEAPDETSHEGRIDLKIEAIEAFDERIVEPCLAHAMQRGDCRVLVAPDHVTAIDTKTHAGGPIPFAVCGPGIKPNGAAAYTESDACARDLTLRRGYALIPHLLQHGEVRDSDIAYLDK